MNILSEKAKAIQLIIFDVDGILTTGHLTYSPNGLEYKDFYVYDGQGIKFLQRAGIEVGIITNCLSAAVKRRMQDLGIQHVYQGAGAKLPAYEDLKQKLQLTDEKIAYMGDDLPDLPILSRVGLSITVPNAPKILQEKAMWVTEKAGGLGAVREVCEFIIHSQNKYESIVESYLS